MKRTDIFRGFLVGLTLLLIIFFGLNYYVKEKVKTEISGLDEPLTYKDLAVNVFLNKFTLKGVETRQKKMGISAKEIQVSGISYYKFLFEDRLDINTLSLDQPKITYFPQDSTGGNTAQKREIRIQSFVLKNGNFSRSDFETSEVDLHARFPEVEMRDIVVAEDLDWGSYRVVLDSVYLKLNAEHNIYLDRTEAEDGRVNISNFRIAPFAAKSEFDRKIPYEKDWISLQVSNIAMDNFSIEEHNDTLLFKESKMTISEAVLEIYRNKLLKDDVRRKPLYSELLREAPIKIDVEKILVENSEIIYEEQVQEGRQESVIRFADVSAEINNLHNLSSKELPQPEISARANFMRGTPVNLSWTFPVFDPENNFSISGGFGTLEGEALDPFLVSALDLQVRGEINSINFNFSGNEETMGGDFILDYKELEVELLKDEGEESKSFFSAIANLFVRNEDDAGAEDEMINVERDKQRSFWNYVWLGLREGFMETVGRL